VSAYTPDGEDHVDALDIPGVCRASGLGRSYVYEAIRRGELRARKYGRLTRILIEDYRRWLDGAPSIEPTSGKRRGPSPTSTTAAASPRKSGSRAMRRACNASGGSRPIGRRGRRNSVNFERVNQAALAVLPSLLERWLPGGRIEGHEYVALNPKRADRYHGSFRISPQTGQWADVAVQGASGGDMISRLAAINRSEACRR
jgi:excisionase family DNA binding protein